LSDLITFQNAACCFWWLISIEILLFRKRIKSFTGITFLRANVAVVELKKSKLFLKYGMMVACGVPEPIVRHHFVRMIWAGVAKAQGRQPVQHYPSELIDNSLEVPF